MFKTRFDLGRIGVSIIRRQPSWRLLEDGAGFFSRAPRSLPLNISSSFVSKWIMQFLLISCRQHNKTAKAGDQQLTHTRTCFTV